MYRRSSFSSSSKTTILQNTFANHMAKTQDGNTESMKMEKTVYEGSGAMFEEDIKVEESIKNEVDLCLYLQMSSSPLSDWTSWSCTDQ